MIRDPTWYFGPLRGVKNGRKFPISEKKEAASFFFWKNSAMRRGGLVRRGPQKRGRSDYDSFFSKIDGGERGMRGYKGKGSKGKVSSYHLKVRGERSPPAPTPPLESL